jgi:toxin CptA
MGPMKPQRPAGRHEAVYPSARKIRRACGVELYRTIKRLGRYIPPEKIEEAEKLYFRKVAENLIWIHENRDNRRKLADWWEEHVCPEIAALWDVEPKRLGAAFRAAFGG